VFLAAGYLATAALAAAHLLSFHGPFAPGKLLAAGRRPRHGSIWRGTRVFRQRSFLNAVAGALVVERRNRVAMLAALALGATVAALIVLRTPGMRCCRRSWTGTAPTLRRNSSPAECASSLLLRC
jgi:hypothetical protein